MIKEGGRLYTCIREMRALRAELEKTDSSLPTVRQRDRLYSSCADVLTETDGRC